MAMTARLAATTAPGPQRLPVCLEPGERFAKRYRIVRPLAEGGMSSVYLASDLNHNGRQVVLKIIRENIDAGPHPARRALFMEANTFRALSGWSARISSFLAKLRARVFKSRLKNASHIFPKFYESNTHLPENTNGYWFIAMEYIAGTTLGELRRNGERLPLYKAIEIMMQLSGLHTLHKKGLVHRDMKPDNAILRENGNGICILDFGITCAIGHMDGLANPEKIHIIGTPAFMSPEQVTNAAIDQRTDIYAMGLMLYELVTGINPMLAENESDHATLLNQLSDPVPEFNLQHIEKRIKPAQRQSLADPIKKLHAKLNEIIKNMAAKKPEERYPSLTKVRRDLRRAYKLAKKLAPYEKLAKAAPSDSEETPTAS